MRTDVCTCHGVPRVKRGDEWRCHVKLKAHQAAYRNSEKGKATHSRYARSEKGKAGYARSDRKRITTVGNRSIRAKTEAQAQAIRAVVNQMRQEFNAAQRMEYGSFARQQAGEASKGHPQGSIHSEAAAREN